jgi:hypothetical protein
MPGSHDLKSLGGLPPSATIRAYGVLLPTPNFAPAANSPKYPNSVTMRQSIYLTPAIQVGPSFALMKEQPPFPPSRNDPDVSLQLKPSA